MFLAFVQKLDKERSKEEARQPGEDFTSFWNET